MKTELASALKPQCRAELLRLLRWWAEHALDADKGGFFGEIDGDDRPLADAPKSVILNTRLLWFFSAAGRHLASDEALALADIAAAYLKSHFLDLASGGVYWQLDASGRPLTTKKQAYAQAFTLYAFTAYHQASGDAAALTLAEELQDIIELRYWDRDQGGYIEALDAGWQPLADLRLSDKDMDTPKTMNTHLHILEAYTSLHRVAPSARTYARLEQILQVMLDRFIHPSGHLRLFCDMDWTDRSTAISFGHDIEASWLIWEAALVLDDLRLTARARTVTLALASSTLREGLSNEGGLYYERGRNGHLDRDGEWWEQAEALVGFVNAAHLTGDHVWSEAAERVWAFTQRHYGAGGANEWTWYANISERKNPYKAGEWKCPYHNGRAMIELDLRLS